MRHPNYGELRTEQAQKLATHLDELKRQANVGPIEGPREIPRGLDAVSDELRRVEEAFGLLADQLTPVTSMRPNECGDAGPAPTGCTSQHGATLEQFVSRLRALHMFITATRAGVQV